MDVQWRCNKAGIACRAAAVLALGLSLLGIGSGCGRPRTKYPERRAENAVVSVDLSVIGSGRGHFYTYRAGSGKNVDFLVYRESAGEPRAVLDACRTCYRWRKGYRLEGNEVVCVKCDLRFKLDGLARGTGSCVPIALKAGQREDFLDIPVTELEAGAHYF